MHELREVARRGRENDRRCELLMGCSVFLRNVAVSAFVLREFSWIPKSGWVVLCVVITWLDESI
jgi:hypothetical protein